MFISVHAIYILLVLERKQVNIGSNTLTGVSLYINATEAAQYMYLFYFSSLQV